MATGTIRDSLLRSQPWPRRASPRRARRVLPCTRRRARSAAVADGLAHAAQRVAVGLPRRIAIVPCARISWERPGWSNSSVLATYDDPARTDGAET